MSREEPQLYCPSCGEDNVSVQGVETWPATFALGVLLVVACEHCDGGKLQFNFHQGATFIEPA